jgi:hypothetical protein
MKNGAAGASTPTAPVPNLTPEAENMRNVSPAFSILNPISDDELCDLRRRALDTAALVEAAAELAAPVDERAVALLAAAERSADETLATVERMIGERGARRQAVEELAERTVANDRTRRARSTVGRR